MEVLKVKLKKKRFALLVALLLGLSSIANDRARPQPKPSNWSVIAFPHGQPVEVGLITVNGKTLRALWRSTGQDPGTCGKCDVPSPKATIRSASGASNIELSLVSLPKEVTVYLYVVDVSGSVRNSWELKTNDQGGGRWLHLQTSTDTFMLALSVANKLTDVETDKNVIMISTVPDGFAKVPRRQ